MLILFFRAAIYPPFSQPVKNRAQLPFSNGYDLVLMITDHDCTKAVIFIPCNEAITAEGVPKLYLEHVFKCMGLPKIFIHN